MRGKQGKGERRKAKGHKTLPHDGFTLIEIVVATAILAVIFSIVFGSFFYTINNAEEQEERASIYHRANFILNNISQNISSAYVPLAVLRSAESESEIPAETVQPAEEEETQPIFVGTDASTGDVDADSFGAFTVNPRFGISGNGGGFAYVKYEVFDSAEAGEEQAPVDENNPLVLRCSVESPFTMPEADESDEQTQEWEWALNIRSFNAEYFDGTDWVQEWDYDEKKALPAAVKVEIELADSSGAGYPFSMIANVHTNTALDEVAGEEDEESQETEQTQEGQGKKDASSAGGDERSDTLDLGNQ